MRIERLKYERNTIGLDNVKWILEMINDGL